MDGTAEPQVLICGLAEPEVVGVWGIGGVVLVMGVGVRGAMLLCAQWVRGVLGILGGVVSISQVCMRQGRAPGQSASLSLEPQALPAWTKGQTTADEARSCQWGPCSTTRTRTGSGCGWA